MYKYHGIERWSVFWNTPNETGLMLAELLFLLFAVASEFLQWKKGSRVLPLLLVLSTAPFAYALGRTYSRGASLAVLLGIAVMIGYAIRLRHQGQFGFNPRGILRLTASGKMKPMRNRRFENRDILRVDLLPASNKEGLLRVG